MALIPSKVPVGIAAAVAISVIVTWGSSEAAVVTNWELTNNTGMTVSDFEGDWSGTGGSLRNLIILTNGGPGDVNKAASSASLSPPPALAEQTRARHSPTTVRP